MGKFILIDFKKREEQAEIQKLVSAICLKMDQWIHDYDCGDNTPPNEEESAALEEEHIKELLVEYDVKAAQLWRVKELHAEKRELVVNNLNKRKGRLARKYGDVVAALKDQAAATMTYCVETFEEFEKAVQGFLPCSESELDKLFENHKDHCKNYIESTFPDGVTGMDSYDDGMPDGLPSYDDFKAMVETKQEEYKAKNKEAIEPAVEKVKAKSHDMFKSVINKAIEKAIEEIVEDLSDDTLPYLDEDAMQVLRDELIASAKEYGASRIES